MSLEGLVFKPFSYILPRFKTPALAAVATGLLACALVLLFDLQQLINMMSIGTLLAYCLVSACTLVLRYTPDNPYMIMEPAKDNVISESFEMDTGSVGETNAEEQTSGHVTAGKEVDEGEVPYKSEFVKKIVKSLIGRSNQSLLRRFFLPASSTPTKAIAHLVTTCTVVLFFNMFFLSITLNQPSYEPYMYFFIALFSLVFLILTIVIARQPQTKEIQTFKVVIFNLTQLKSTKFLSFHRIFL
jgi:amino acid transporter